MWPNLDYRHIFLPSDSAKILFCMSLNVNKGHEKNQEFCGPFLNTFQCPSPVCGTQPHGHLFILKCKSQKRCNKYIVLFVKKRLNHFLRLLVQDLQYVLSECFQVYKLWLILMSPHCPGKCSHRPGGGARWKDTGPRHLPGASSGETECYWGAAATGNASITPNSVLTACRQLQNQPDFGPFWAELWSGALFLLIPVSAWMRSSWFVKLKWGVIFFNTVSLYDKNLNKVAADWREITRELKMSGK